MGRTYSSPFYIMLFFNGFKSVVTILVEATPLKSKNDIIPDKNES